MKDNSFISPLHTSPREREPAFAFMSRLAAIGSTSVVEFGQDVELPFADALKGETSVLKGLSSLSGAHLPAIEDWTPAVDGDAKRSLHGHRFPARPMLTSEVRGCPCCLREDIAGSSLPPHRAMTFRSHWLIHHVSLCLRHGRQLVVLWKVAAPTQRYDTAAQFRLIADQVISGALQGEEREPTDFEIWFDKRLEGKPHAATWLDEHPLHAAAVFCRLLGTALLKLQGIHLSQIAPGSDWGCYQMGFEVARHGEQAVLKALQKLNRLAEPRHGPKAVFPMLYDRLTHDHKEDPDFTPFRKLLGKHLRASWPLGPGDDLLGTPVTVRTLHSVRTAAEETGVDVRRLRKMLEASTMIDPNLPDSWAVFDAAEAKPMLSSLVDFMSAKEFFETFHIGRSQFNLLVKDGILQPALKDVDSKHVWDPRDGRAFLDRLLVGAETIQQAQHGWEKIAKSAQRLKLRPGDIIRAICDGRIHRVARNAQFDGYAAVHVYHDEVAQILAQDQPSAMSLRLFAETVGLGNPVYLSRLVRDGHVSTTEMRNPRTKAMQRFIAPHDAAAFHNRFVTLRVISKAKGTSWQSLSHHLRRAGVMPFSTDNADYGNIYLKKDVEAVLAD
ncbi:TniQ family protein [Parasedimentitalea denitrificans]|nr:TniQ family protein [Sedimentitalea sp. CY04]